MTGHVGGEFGWRIYPSGQTNPSNPTQTFQAVGKKEEEEEQEEEEEEEE